MKQIIIGDHVMEHIESLFNLTVYSKVFIVTDKTVKSLFIRTLLSGLTGNPTVFAIPTGEKEKNLVSVQKILSAMHEARCDRDSLVINLGGGVISDLGGFAASIFMRGVDVINIPTTLLAQADAGVGGKTGVNFMGVKNLIGTFNQPIGVVIDVATLNTLPDREFISGFAEIIKHGLIADPILFRLAISKKPREFTHRELADIITRSCKIKIDIVRKDTKEKGNRKLLNFGHTVGHAIEALSQTTKLPLLHGEAVVLGMIVETKLSQLTGLLSQGQCNVITQCLQSFSLTKNPCSIPSILTLIQSDKKSANGIIQWTLLKKIGEGVVNQTVNTDVVIQALKGTIV